jgi:hypothetical protein
VTRGCGGGRGGGGNAGETDHLMLFFNEIERSEREVISVLKMRENSREGKIRWIKFNCCAKQTVLVKQKRKHISFLKNVSNFY